MHLIDRLADVLARLSAVLYAAIGLMLGFEVTARYLFNAPTIWAEELSRLALTWATLLGAAWLVHDGGHVRVTMLLDSLSDRPRRVLEIFSLLFVAAIAALLAVHGWSIAEDSLVRGRTTGSMLDIPIWTSQIAVPVGAVLLTVQCLLEAGRIARGGPLPKAAHEAEATPTFGDGPATPSPSASTGREG